VTQDARHRHGAFPFGSACHDGHATRHVFKVKLSVPPCFSFLCHVTASAPTRLTLVRWSGLSQSTLARQHPPVTRLAGLQSMCQIELLGRSDWLVSSAKPVAAQAIHLGQPCIVPLHAATSQLMTVSATQCSLGCFMLALCSRSREQGVVGGFPRAGIWYAKHLRKSQVHSSKPKYGLTLLTK
jgi:hypothetical protein